MELLSPGLPSQRSDQDSEFQSDTDDRKSLEPLRSLDPEAMREEGPVQRWNPPRASLRKVGPAFALIKSQATSDGGNLSFTGYASKRWRSNNLPILTGDESWVHHSTPETKRQSMVWKKPEENVPNKAKVTISAGKFMAIFFWDCKGVLLVDYLPPNTTVNSAWYCENLTKLRAAIKQKRPGPLSQKVLLVHDNARPHAARTTQTLLENFKWEIFTHPPYSTELAPSDFYLFPALKLHLGGKHFANDDKVQAKANHWL
ncbi:hypothetical protein LAZ67_1001064 [Cordylochernes scorpioides]|uniref:Transposase n=1 Tax=Cordylochernes scorpioides TaxID=51811 RepID=A0ABY6JXQ4_9ARAC|nr:hypothetical protein LAZ67_1001064 [Cordylochernes scorpioides]